MGKRMALLFSVLVLSGSYAWAQSLEQKLTAFIAATPHPQHVEDFQGIPPLSPLKQGTPLFCWSFSTTDF